jgi:YVTN family beta-propeller protein
LVAINLVSAEPYAFIANSNSNTITVIDTASKTVVGDPIPVGYGPAGIGVSPDGAWVYVSNEDANTVSVINAKTLAIVGDPIPVLSKPCGIAFGMGGARAYVAHCGAGKVVVIDTATRQIIHTTAVIASNAIGAAGSPDGEYIFVTDNNNGMIIRLATSTNATFTSKRIFVRPNGLAVSADGKTLYVANSQDSTLMFVDATKLTLNDSVSTGGTNPVCVAINPAGTRAYVSNFGYTGNGNTVGVVDLGTHSLITTIPAGSGPEGVAVTPDGTKVFVVNKFSNNVMVIDATTNKVVGEGIEVGSNPTTYGIFIKPFAAIMPTATPTPTSIPVATVSPSPGVETIPAFPVSRVIKVKISANKKAGRAPLAVKFKSSVKGKGTKTWYWDFDGDGVIDSNVKNPRHIFAEPGKYKIGLTVAVGEKISKRAKFAVKVKAGRIMSRSFRTAGWQEESLF